MVLIENRKVESMMVDILRRRFIDCLHYHGKDDPGNKCVPLYEEFRSVETDWFIKCELMEATLTVIY